MPGPADFGVDRFTVPAVLDRRAEQYPDRVMMSIAGVDVTFEQMRQRSCAAANVLADLGVGFGDCAAVNAANKGDFLLHTLRLARAKVILTDAERRARVDEVADALETVTDVVVQGDSLTTALCSSADDPVTDSPAALADVGVLFYTSGTTGPSKAVVTTWHYLFSVAATAASAWDFRAGEVLWTA